MNRFTPILETPSLSLGRFDHPADRPHRDPGRETASGYAIGFLEQGAYEISAGRRRWQLTPGMAFLTGPDAAYRVRHAEARPTDVSLVVSYAGSFVGERSLPPLSVLSPSNRLAYLRLRLARTGEAAEPLAVEGAAAELLDAAADPFVEQPLFRENQLAWYAERIEAARETLEARTAEPHSLAALAAAAGMSPFHFARVFRALVGAPPHRYLLRLRLAKARQRLLDGESVTRACFAVGFNNLSHFIRAFRRAYGASPSRLKN